MSSQLLDYDPWISGGLPWINVAAIVGETRALGPGTRTAVWVQGCDRRCPGCISPEWIPNRVSRLIRPDELAEMVFDNSNVEGVTLSGGEPMRQAAGLAEFIRLGRLVKNFNVICFTGYLYEDLISNPPGPGVQDLLKQIDVLIDGPYIKNLNDGIGLRGSSNQRIIYLTDRLSKTCLSHLHRQIELHVNGESVLLVGIPSPKLHRLMLKLTSYIRKYGDKYSSKMR